MMRGRVLILGAGVPLLAARALHAQQPASRGRAEIVAILEEGGGGLSADEVGKKTRTDVETVRSCTDQWRRSMKGSPGP